MMFDGLRWRIKTKISGMLLSERPDHPLRRTYAVLRRWPPIQILWKIMAGETVGGWRDVRAYAAHGRAFAQSATSPPAFGAPREFEDPKFFSDLLRRIADCEPVDASPSGPAILINNGLSAGGAERQIVFTLTGLKAAGERVAFVGEYVGRSPDLDFHLPALRDAGVDCMTPENVTRPGGDIYRRVTRPVAEALAMWPLHLMIEILDMVALLRRLKPPVVHLWQDETSTKHGIAALIAGVPRIVLSGRNVNPTHFSFHQAYMRPAYLALASSPRVVFSNNSRAGANSYADWLGVDPARIRVIYNAVDPDAWPAISPDARQALRRREAIGPQQPVVIGVFRLADEKRPLLWIEAAAAMRRRRPDVAFLLAGDGPLRGAVESRIRDLGLGEAVRLLGEVKDVGTAMAASDLFFLSSREEGTPNALLEAQHYGLACVITRAGGAPEALAEGVTGRVAEDDAPEALGKMLAGMLDDTALRAAAKRAGPTFVMEHFGLARMIAETRALYRA